MTARGVARKSANGYEVTFKRLIPHGPDRVWEMLTEPAKIARWFCARVEIDGRVGGKMVEHHAHVGVDVFGEVTRWERPKVFEHSWWFGDARADPMGTVLWELFPGESGTGLVLTHRRGVLDAGGIAGAHISLDVLAAVLDGDDPEVHAAPEGEFRHGEFVQTRAGRGLWADREKLEQDYRKDLAAV